MIMIMKTIELYITKKLNQDQVNMRCQTQDELTNCAEN